MKTKVSMKLIIGIFTISLISFNSCEKENELDKTNSSQQANAEKQIVLDNVPNISNPHNVELYTLNNKDADDEKIKKDLLEIAQAARQVLKETSINENVLKNATVNVNNSVDLLKIVNEGKLKSTSEAYPKLLAAIHEADLTHVSTNPLKSGKIEEYIPAIHVPNAETADMNKQPLVSPGFEVNCELPGMEQYEGYIVAWYYDNKGNQKEILINEETAMNTSHPVFIIDNAEAEATNTKKSKIDYSTKKPEIDYSDSSHQMKSTMSRTEYHSCEYQINKRYESWGKSEFCITGAHINENGGVQLICRRDDGTYNLWKKVAKVKKKHIGDLRENWEQFCSNDVRPFSSNYVF